MFHSIISLQKYLRPEQEQKKTSEAKQPTRLY